MYILMREFPHGKYSIEYKAVPEGFTRKRVVAEEWVADLGWEGKRYFVEVEEIKKVQDVHSK